MATTPRAATGSSMSGGFVAQQIVGLLGEGAAEAGTLELAVADLSGCPVREVGVEPDPLREPVDVGVTPATAAGSAMILRSVQRGLHTCRGCWASIAMPPVRGVDDPS